MRKQNLILKQRKNSNNEERANQLLNKIDQISFDIKLEKKSTNIISKSINKISQQIKSLASTHEEKFTQSPSYKLGKTQLFLNSTKFDDQHNIVDLLRIIDNKDPRKKKFLTPELMQSKLTKKIFQSRKRGFGSNEQIFMKQELEKTRQYEGIGSKQSLILKKILISEHYSPQMKIHNLQNNYDSLNSESVCMGKKGDLRYIGMHKSPVIYKKVCFRKNFDDMNINKDYKEIVKKKEIEDGINKVKLRRLVSLKSVFKMNS
jgi:hypothetical protein